MAVCDDCGNDTSVPSGCKPHAFRFEGDPKLYRAVRYGSEEEDWGAASGEHCHDCGCPPGAFHHDGCDVERCPRCGGQVIGCDCDLADVVVETR